MLRNIVRMHAPGAGILVTKNSGTTRPSVTACGTAFVCHDRGYLLTAAHSINIGSQLAVVGFSPSESFMPVTRGQVSLVDVELVQIDHVRDVALLKTTRTDDVTGQADFLYKGDSSDLPVGSSLCALGFPYAHQGLHTLSVKAGVLAAKVLSSNGTKQFQIDAMVEPGNSGGPLIDVATGKIIGVVSGRYNPMGGSGGGVFVGNVQLGSESSISYATAITHALDLMRAEGLNV